MYATFHDNPPPAPAERYLLQHIGDGRQFTIMLWDTEERARAAVPRADEIYEVLDDWYGPAAEQAAHAASIAVFEGPVSAAHFEAGMRDHEKRLKPASATAEGFIRGLLLWQPNARSVRMVATAASLETLEADSRAVYTTPLPPDEDPALIMAPDRVEVCRVLDHVPAA
ncbi:hypothetical protein ACFLIM_28060 [Nonomuraea sp. M3C6]|uniref:Uncharacterized protein n=1 Tax=Nonomuraea marmarensis TaxID=3351344 RepID=A0ABW7AIW2_9ACTN